MLGLLDDGDDDLARRPCGVDQSRGDTGADARDRAVGTSLRRAHLGLQLVPVGVDVLLTALPAADKGVAQHAVGVGRGKGAVEYEVIKPGLDGVVRCCGQDRRLLPGRPTPLVAGNKAGTQPGALSAEKEAA